jgi:putative methyltransferase (TIGR04325 family)
MTSPNVIIDFGGSSGWSWDYLRNTLRQQAVSSYVIVELDSVCSYMKASHLHDEIIEYCSVDAPLAGCDLLYGNSVLQYFESNAPLLSLVNRTTPSYIFLEDLIAADDEDFYSMQPYHNMAIPYRFIGLECLLKDMATLGYREVVRFPYLSPVRGVMSPLPMSNFPDKLRVRYAQSILLNKSTNNESYDLSA